MCHSNTTVSVFPHKYIWMVCHLPLIFQTSMGCVCMVMGKVLRHWVSSFPLWLSYIVETDSVYNLDCSSLFCVDSAIFQMLNSGGRRNGRKIKSWSFNKNSYFETFGGMTIWWQGIWRNTGQKTRCTNLGFLITVWHQPQNPHRVHSHELRLSDLLAILSPSATRKQFQVETGGWGELGIYRGLWVWLQSSDNYTAAFFWGAIIDNKSL